MRRFIESSVLAAILVGCQAPVSGRPQHIPPANPPGSPSAAGQMPPCLRAPESRAYFDGVRRAVEAKWELSPSGADGFVRIRLVLRASGELVSAELVEESPSGFGASALAALHEAQPLPPLPPEAACIAGYPLILSFTVENDGP